jgi:hypothetical protein
MVRTPEAKAEAAAQPELSLVAIAAPWEIYEVAGSEIVVPLEVQPVVVADRPGDQRERHLELGTSWFQQRQDWPAIPADDGPADWQRIGVDVDRTRREGEPGGPGRRVDIVVPTDPIVPVPLDPVTVSDVVIEQDRLSFTVDRIGVPVMVRMSYFPNWRAEGADGVHRVVPNSIVVVPTRNEVVLSYGRTTWDWLTMLATAVGIGACVFWRRRGDMSFASEMPAARRPPESPDGPGEAEVVTDVPSSDAATDDVPVAPPAGR